jgi:hypothetical protein
MLTLNSVYHSRRGLEYKPDPNLGPDEQDKRSAVEMEIGDVGSWPFGTVDQVAGCCGWRKARCLMVADVTEQPRMTGRLACSKGGYGLAAVPCRQPVNSRSCHHLPVATGTFVRC